MVNALTCNSSRVLTPSEADQMRAVISKPSSRILFDLMLYTGLRLVEVKQLKDNPNIFDQERRTITIRSGKVKASQLSRNVCLSDRGLVAVQEYLKNPSVPSSSTVWQQNLIRWGQRARLQHVPGEEDTNNPNGLTVRTTRKSWESWLLSAYPEKLPYITLSQGHSETTSLRHYLNISFMPAEKDAIKEQVKGWACLS